MPTGIVLENTSAVSFFEKVDNGFLSKKTHSKPSWTSKMEYFTKSFNDLKSW